MNYLPLKILEYLKSKTDDAIIAIYLTGSRLNNLGTEDSDVDYYVITFPRFDDLIFNRKKTYQGSGDGINYKMMNLFHFINLIFKANPNVIELFYRDPLFINEVYRPLGDWLKGHREALPMLNPTGWEKACIGLMTHSCQTFKRSKMYRGMGSDGKEVVNFFKAFQYFTAEYEKASLEGVVTFDDNSLRQWTLEMKNYENVSDEERQQIVGYMERQIDAAKLHQGELEKGEFPRGLMENLLKVTKRTYIGGTQLLDEMN